MNDLNTKSSDLYYALRAMGLSHKVAFAAVVAYVAEKAAVKPAAERKMKPA